MPNPEHLTQYAESILGAFLLFPDSVAATAPPDAVEIFPDDYRPVLASMFRVFRRLGVVVPRHVEDDMHSQGHTLDGGIAWLVGLTDCAPVAVDPSRWAVLREAHRDREVARVLGNDDMPTAARVDAAKRILEASAPVPDSGRMDILAALNSPAPPMSWIFRDIIPRSAIVNLNAQGGTGKSYLLLQLAISAATCWRMLTRFECSVPCRTFALFAEDSPEEVHRRLKKVAAGFHVPEDLYPRIADYLTVAAGNPAPIINAKGEPTPRYFDLLAQVRDMQAELVILDPRSHFFAGDENDNAQAARFNALLQAFTTAHPLGTAVMVAHHVAKARQGQMDSASGRGASAARDGARAVISMTPLTEEQGNKLKISDWYNVVRVRLVKSNYSLPQTEFWLRRDTSLATGGILLDSDRPAYIPPSYPEGKKHSATTWDDDEDAVPF